MNRSLLCKLLAVVGLFLFAVRRRFRWSARSWLLVPADNDDAPVLWSRLALFPLLFIPWLLLYVAVVYRGPQPGAFETFLPGEVHWPIWQWMEIFYVSPYLLVTLAPFAATTNAVLRRFQIAAWIATVLVVSIFLSVPAIAPFRPFEPHGILGKMMVMDRQLDQNNGTASFPSFHVVWSFLGAMVWSQRMPRWRTAWLTWATIVSLSCVFTGMHSLLDVVAGFFVFLLTYHYAAVLTQFERATRRLLVQR